MSDTTSAPHSSLELRGYCILASNIPGKILGTLRETLFQNHNAGERCLLDHSAVRETALTLKRELVLHASSQATEPKHRRILHFVYHSGEAIPETWHRAI